MERHSLLVPLGSRSLTSADEPRITPVELSSNAGLFISETIREFEAVEHSPSVYYLRAHEPAISRFMSFSWAHWSDGALEAILRNEW